MSKPTNQRPSMGVLHLRNGVSGGGGGGTIPSPRHPPIGTVGGLGPPSRGDQSGGALFPARGRWAGRGVPVGRGAAPAMEVSPHPPPLVEALDQGTPQATLGCPHSGDLKGPSNLGTISGDPSKPTNHPQEASHRASRLRNWVSSRVVPPPAHDTPPYRYRG